MARPLPTTKAQVSGHKFLRRRIEHGLVLGDIRMIHDPLASRRRALMFGGVAVAFLSLGSGLVAWMQPDPQPGQAQIIRSPQGQLMVDVDGTYHPVQNLASARLIAGQPAEPAAVGETFLSHARLGTPVGIGDAPNFLAASGETGPWSACLDPQEEEVIVVAGTGAAALGDTTAAVAEVEGRQWLLTAQGRVVLPETASTQGRVLRRAIGMTEKTPVWRLPAELLNAFEEQRPLSFPAQPPQILDTGEGLWARTDNGVTPVTQTQAEMLVGVGAQRLPTQAQEIAALGDATPTFNLPTSPLNFVGPEDGWLCADGKGTQVAAPVGATVQLAGESVASRFAGLEQGGVGVDSGHGYHVVSATGTRHDADAAALAALGVDAQARVPWEVLALLPEGSELSREGALRPARS